ncbi:hypothetical protein KAI92_04070 [Candidatus Parcubacteria bacterium]|nr:hypothetical protein [Candidatus Parcubacteria bacterium]
MLSAIKWFFRLILSIVIIFGVGYVYFNYIDKGQVLTKDQQEIISTLGRPEQFTLTYVPKGSDKGSEFVRHEVWLYPSTKRKVTFLGGKVVGTEELEIEDDVKYKATQLKIEDFDFYTSFKDVEKQVGKINLIPIEIPVFFSDGVETYASKDAMFIFEDSYLTYMETLD